MKRPYVGPVSMRVGFRVFRVFLSFGAAPDDAEGLSASVGAMSSLPSPWLISSAPSITALSLLSPLWDPPSFALAPYWLFPSVPSFPLWSRVLSKLAMISAIISQLADDRPRWSL